MIFVRPHCREALVRRVPGGERKADGSQQRDGANDQVHDDQCRAASEKDYGGEDRKCQKQCLNRIAASIRRALNRAKVVVSLCRYGLNVVSND